MFGQLGSTVSHALTTEFFQWFHLEKTGESAEGGLTNHVYQPVAPKFHDLVLVTLTTDGTQQLRKVQLAVRRSFIDSPKDFTMAADITKSFLAASLNPQDAAAMQEATVQIRHYHPAESGMTTMKVAAGARGKQSDEDMFEGMQRAIAAGEPVYATMKSFKREGSRLVPSDEPTPEAPLPGEGEPLYLAYNGKRRQLEQNLSSATLRMANGNVGGSEQLTISVS
jgi:hypothetical protein